MKKYTFFILAPFIIVTIMSLQSLNNGNQKEISKRDSLELDRMKYINLIKESIKGKEKLPTDSVFKNIVLENNLYENMLTDKIN